ncbi:MAG TPA: TerB family tellurite resistance protein [Aliidongia sp.]|uniref:tellurite resistance TerB family protein n=1 Tax=Aliidongia sp. TaxID=1914230 RepID=UPI002DDCC0B4|nr:TerB family tellurite resistance protein [Aliidongia sp.]HEV2678290.1 TerB family tellurite resistance protein [Aliidongia sp.]
MFDRILDLLMPGGAPRGEPEIHVAVAALLVEAARMDDRFDPAERRAIRRVLGRRFALDEASIDQLIATAEQAVEGSSALYRFTRVVAERFDPAARVGMIEMLWEVAYADGTLDPDEDALIRRIAGLIFVEDHERGVARQRVLARSGNVPQG